jgi:hypothetical protein
MALSYAGKVVAAYRKGRAMSIVRPDPMTPSFIVGQAQEAFTAPDTNNSQPLRITPIYDPKWGMDKFAQKSLIKFGHHATYIGMIAQRLDSLKNLDYQPYPDIRNPLLRIPRPHIL